jgi:hypothetical protein
MSRRRGWFGRVKRGCYQSNTFCGPIQGDMNAKSKVQSPKSEVARIGGLPRSSVSPPSSLSGSYLRYWRQAAPAPGRSRAARPSRHTSRPVSSSRPPFKARMLPSPPSRIRRASRCAPIPCPQARESSNPRRPLPPQHNYQPSTFSLPPGRAGRRAIARPRLPRGQASSPAPARSLVRPYQTSVPGRELDAALMGDSPGRNLLDLPMKGTYKAPYQTLS